MSWLQRLRSHTGERLRANAQIRLVFEFVSVIAVLFGCLTHIGTSPAIAADVNYRAIALTGDPGPSGRPGTTFSDLEYLSLNGSGQFAFYATLSNSDVSGEGDASIWTGRPNQLQMLARQGDQIACDCGSGVTYDSLDVPYLGTGGHVAFNFRMVGPGVDNSNNQGSMVTTDDGLRLIARSGDAAPETEPGEVFSSFSFPVVDAAGQVAFRAFLTGPGVSIGNEGVWISPPTEPTKLLYREGAAAHDIGPEAVYQRTSSHLALNDNGQLTYWALLKGAGVNSSNNQGIWYGSPSELQLIAREGDPVPGLGPEVTYSFLDSPPVLNNLGVVFVLEQYTQAR